MDESIVLSSIFKVVTYIDVPAFKYRFPTVMLPIELFDFDFSCIQFHFPDRTLPFLYPFLNKI